MKLEDVPVWIRPRGRIWHILAKSNSGWNQFLCMTITPNEAARTERVPDGPKCRKCMENLKAATRTSE